MSATSIKRSAKIGNTFLTRAGTEVTRRGGPGRTFRKYFLLKLHSGLTSGNPSTFTPLEKREIYNDDWVINQMHAVIIL